MNIKRKVVQIELNGKEYDFILDFASAIDFQEYYGKSIFIGLEKISTEQDLVALAKLIASCLKTKDGKSVGMEFVKNIDLIDGSEFFISKIEELMSNSLPKEKDASKKKYPKQKKN